MKTTYIYKLLFPNGDIYIGYSSDVESRLSKHKKSFNENKLNVEILKEVLDNRESYWEQYFINHYNLLGFNLRNITVGGNGGSCIREEYKVTEKIQVLISQQDMAAVNSLLMMEALENGTRPIPLSTFVRELIKSYIEENRHKLGQRSFAKEEVRRYLNTMKEHKTKSDKNE